MPNLSQDQQPQEPLSIKDITDRILLLLRALAGSTIGIIIVGTIGLIFLIIFSILKGF